jgi:hypothetical protein
MNQAIINDRRIPEGAKEDLLRQLHNIGPGYQPQTFREFFTSPQTWLYMIAMARSQG